jgi:hypothetical protein
MQTDEEIAYLEAVKRLDSLLNPPKIVYYIHYDDDGLIKNVRNYLETHDNLPYIEMDGNSFDFKNFKIQDYAVINENNQMVLTKIEKIFDKILSIKDIVYEIPKISIYQEYEITDEDIIIEQDSWHSEFRIRLSKKWSDTFGHLRNVNRNIVLYVTKEQDPNILYKTLNIPIYKLIGVPSLKISYDDFKDTPCSIYGTRYFEKYLHIHYV